MTLSLEEVTATLAAHVPLYRRRAPRYQTVMLNALESVWQGEHRRLLDIGGGTGVVGQAIQDLLPVHEVVAIDVEDRFLASLTIESSCYDGKSIPFDDGSFDAASLNNVIHHIPPVQRVTVLREVRRVVTGPVYVKDHVAGSWLDHGRLAALDLMGNLPFSGMVSASYLSKTQWQSLAAAVGYRIAEQRSDRYRSGLFAQLFPNALEITMRWEVEY